MYGFLWRPPTAANKGMGRIGLYISYFKRYLQKKREARRPVPADFEEIKEEIWQADFSKPETARFIEEAGDGYESRFKKTPCGKSGFSLVLKRKHLYAWTVNPVFRYKDFVAEADLILPKADFSKPEKEGSAGSCACGLIFRHISDKAFYALLVSDRGWVRLDAVVNSTPMPILGWTKPVTDKTKAGGTFGIRLICVGTAITVLADGVWLGKFETDRVQAAGKIGFAAQNWEDYPVAEFFLSSFKINSIPVFAEAADSEANNSASIPPEAHINLAQTYYAMGQYVSALYAVKQARKMRPSSVSDHLLTGKIYFAQRLTEEAEGEFLKALELDSENGQALTELAGLYYHLNETKKLKAVFKRLSDEAVRSSVVLCSLKAHLLSAEGKHKESAGLYGQAFTLEPQNGILKYNEANELYRSGETAAACEAYFSAGSLFLAAEEYKDLADTVNALERLAPEDGRTCALSGKFHYALGNMDEALEAFRRLCDAGTKDAAVWYLYGLLVQNTDGTQALKAFKKACSLDKTSGLYRFRLAETLYLNGEDCSAPLAEAERLDPENGWVYNLKGLCAMDTDDFKTAEAEIIKARKLLPDEIVILENYAEALRLQGRLEECAPLFDVDAGTADLAAERNRAMAFQIFANALFFDGQYERAEPWYRKALRINPANAELLTDTAENALEIGLLNEADDLLVKAFDIEPSKRIYRLIAAVAVKKGDYARAEVTLKKAAEECKGAEAVLFDLADLYLNTNKTEKAAELAKLLKKYADNTEFKDRFTALSEALKRSEHSGAAERSRR